MKGRVMFTVVWAVFSCAGVLWAGPQVARDPRWNQEVADIVEQVLGSANIRA